MNTELPAPFGALAFAGEHVPALVATTAAQLLRAGHALSLTYLRDAAPITHVLLYGAADAPAIAALEHARFVPFRVSARACWWSWARDRAALARLLEAAHGRAATFYLFEGLEVPPRVVAAADAACFAGCTASVAPGVDGPRPLVHVTQRGRTAAVARELFDAGFRGVGHPLDPTDTVDWYWCADAMRLAFRVRLACGAYGSEIQKEGP